MIAPNGQRLRPRSSCGLHGTAESRALQRFDRFDLAAGPPASSRPVRILGLDSSPAGPCRLNRLRKNALSCRSERSEESLFDLRASKKKQGGILRFAQNDNL